MTRVEIVNHRAKKALRLDRLSICLITVIFETRHFPRGARFKNPIRSRQMFSVKEPFIFRAFRSS